MSQTNKSQNCLDIVFVDIAILTHWKWISVLIQTGFPHETYVRPKELSKSIQVDAMRFTSCQKINIENESGTKEVEKKKNNSQQFNDSGATMIQSKYISGFLLRTSSNKLLYNVRISQQHSARSLYLFRL